MKFFLCFLVFLNISIAQTPTEKEQKAIQGDIEAQATLGMDYFFGTTVPENYEEAIKWSTLAANQGDVTSQSLLGIIYTKQRNYEEAFKWLTLAANQGDMGSQNSLGIMYDEGIGIEKNYLKALKWFRLAAEQNY